MKVYFVLHCIYSNSYCKILCNMDLKKDPQIVGVFLEKKLAKTKDF